MCIITQYAVEMRVCAEKNCGGEWAISVTGVATPNAACEVCQRNRYWECERAYFKSPKGRAAQKRYRETPRRRALHKEYVRAYLASAKGKAAMKRYRQSAKGQAAAQGRPKKVSIGERRIAQRKGKGVYHINAVDEVTQQVVGATAAISEAWLEPLLKAMIEQFPFRRGFQQRQRVPQSHGGEVIEQAADRTDQVASGLQRQRLGGIEKRRGDPQTHGIYAPAGRIQASTNSTSIPI